PRIIFIEADGTEHAVDAQDGFSIMEAARDNDVPGIEAECGGAGSCATCHVYIGTDWIAAVGRAGRAEHELLELVECRRDESRLSCQINICQDLDGLVVQLPESQGF